MSEEVTEESPQLQQLVKVYIKMRDKRSAIKATYEDADKVIKDQMDLLEREFMQVCNTTGASSVKVAGAGTIIRGKKTRYWTSDWENMYEFIKEHNQVELLEKRVSQGNMKTFLDANPGLMPRGMNVDTEYTITVRRS